MRPSVPARDREESVKSIASPAIHQLSAQHESVESPVIVFVITYRRIRRWLSSSFVHCDEVAMRDDEYYTDICVIVYDKKTRYGQQTVFKMKLEMSASSAKSLRVVRLLLSMNCHSITPRIHILC